MAKYVRSQITDLTENPVWQDFHNTLLTRLEAARLTLEDLTLTNDELNIQRGAVAELRQMIYIAKSLTENVDLKETEDGQRTVEENL